MERMSYETFLKTKSKSFAPVGFDPPDISDALFLFQRDIVRWALANLFTGEAK